MNATKRVYCDRCGFEVDPFLVKNSAGQDVIHCSVCGLVLDAAEEAEKAIEPLRRIVIADDSQALRELLERVLVQQGMAREVVACANGIECVSQFNALMKGQMPISLALLDVEMPMMTGIQAALSLREMERQYGIQRKAPIMFFTSRKIDDKFKDILKQLQPSSFVNKGMSSDPKELVRRIYKVLKALMQAQQ